MALLVLSVDRDDDFGSKAGVTTPIVGREANLRAATELALQDPEDSDSNCLFAALKIHRELQQSGEEVEVATITGSPRVGSVSDRKLARELEEVLQRTGANRVLLVTDGAEDESILPLVMSRVRVDGVHRVVVRQHAGLETTYYIVRRALDDEKLQRTLLAPLGIVLVILGWAAYTGQLRVGVGFMAIALGALFLWRASHAGKVLGALVRETYGGLTSGKISLVTGVFAGLLFLLGIGYALKSLLDLYGRVSLVRWGVEGVFVLLPWGASSTLLFVLGRFLDDSIRERSLSWRYAPLLLSLLAVTFVLYFATRVARNALSHLGPLVGGEEALLLAVGLALAILASLSNTLLHSKGWGASRRPQDPGAGR